jgi:RNA-binding protein YhbY
LDEQLVQTEMKDLKGAELSWHYAKKPLLRIGVKGATMTHGNSFRQLLEAHTVVKDKVNTQKFGGTYQL